jgi:hypothetical protein
VVVRVVGRSGRVMADPLSRTPDAERHLAAGPMPIPVSAPSPCDTVAIATRTCQ